MRFSEWQFAHNDCTLSLPAPSGRLTGAPPRPRPCPASGNVAASNAAPIESGSRCLFMILISEFAGPGFLYCLRQEKREKREQETILSTELPRLVFSRRKGRNGSITI